jgi:hypothetical protein
MPEKGLTTMSNDELTKMLAAMQAEIKALKAERDSLKVADAPQTGKRSPVSNIERIVKDDKANTLTITINFADVRRVKTGTGKSYLVCRTGQEGKASPLGITFDTNGVAQVHTERVSNPTFTLMLDLLTPVEGSTFTK